MINQRIYKFGCILKHQIRFYGKPVLKDGKLVFNGLELLEDLDKEGVLTSGD